MADSAYLFDPTSDLSAYAQAWIYLSETARDLERFVGLDIERWNELSMPQFALMMMHGVEAVMPNPQRIFYRVTDAAADALVAKASDSVDAFDAARIITTANILNGVAMPASLRGFSAGVINGTFAKPSRQGGGNSNLFLRWHIYEGCRTAHDLFGLDIYRQDHEEPDSAADLMANLSTEFGHTIAYNTIRDWFVKKSYAKFRARCDAATDYMHSKQLFDLGVLKRIP